MVYFRLNRAKLVTFYLIRPVCALGTFPCKGKAFTELFYTLNPTLCFPQRVGFFHKLPKSFMANIVSAEAVAALMPARAKGFFPSRGRRKEPQ